MVSLRLRFEDEAAECGEGSIDMVDGYGTEEVLVMLRNSGDNMEGWKPVVQSAGVELVGRTNRGIGDGDLGSCDESEEQHGLCRNRRNGRESV